MAKYLVYIRKSSETEDKQVLSLESQQKELNNFIKREGLQNVELLEGESKSAKQPGRPLFDRMIRRIERGEADGIIAWHPDRLARNSVDGGKLIYLLDTGKLKDLRFPTYRFDNTSQGKFMLTIIFGQSKYYVDSLSENVKRGNKTKLEKGGFPGPAPVGYLNIVTDHTVVPDPERFRLVRKMWNLLLAGTHTPPQIMKLANDRWGFRTRKTKKQGDKPLCRSLVYRIFDNPFYCGLIKFHGEMFKGAHKPMITAEEFEKAQRIIHGDVPIKPKKHHFAYTGMIRCGQCGCLITAETKVKPSGRKYTYYHCTKKRLHRHCSQKTIRVEELERQVGAILDKITITDKARDWVLDYLKWHHSQETDDRSRVYETQQRSYNAAQRKLDELTEMRFKSMLSDEEYLSWKEKLIKEQALLKSKMADTEHRASRWLELTEQAFLFANKAKLWFQDGNMSTRREILKCLGSNFVLKDGFLHVQLLKPYLLIAEKPKNTGWLPGQGSNLQHPR